MRARGMFSAGLAWGLAAAIVLGAPAYAQSSGAHAVRALPVDTAGQSLTTALTDLARRSNRELLLAAPALGSRAAPRLKGRYTLDQALPLLLEGSGLAYRRSGDGSYIVYVAPVLAPPAPEVPVALPELLVTARTQNSDIQRTENDIQPYKVWTSRDIEQSHSADINEFLHLMATGDTQTSSALQNASGTIASNRSEVNLRGMGSNQTLILVDGRPMPALPAGGGILMLQSDVNGLPISAIDRVEILNSTAGGIYGSGATAGAINIVLKRDYQGADLGVTYGAAEDGGAPTRRVDGRIGFSPGNSRTEVMVAFSLFHADALGAGERDYAAKAREARFANDPASLSSAHPFGASVNVFSLSGETLTLKPAYGGASLGASTTFAPTGYSGAASDGGGVLLANAGRLDLSLSPDVNGANQTLLTQREVTSVIGSVRHRFGASIQAYGDLLVLRNEGRATIPWNSAQGIPVIASSPTNPFQQDIYLTFPTPGFDPVAHNRTRTIRGSVGVIADLAHGWKASADYSAGSARLDVGVDARTMQSSLFRAVFLGRSLDGAPLVSPLGGQQAFLAALATHTYNSSFWFSQVDRLKERSVRLAGPILDLGGGPLTLTLTATDRRDRIPPTLYHGLDQVTGAAIDSPWDGLAQSKRHLYAELRAPLTDRDDGPTGLKGLELQLALSHERNQQDLPINTDDPTTVMTKIVHTTTLYTVGFKVFPVPGLMVRASASSGFLLPGINQYGGSNNSYTSDPDLVETGAYVLLETDAEPKDPRRNGEPLGLASGYSAHLGRSHTFLPERSHSVSAGVVLTPAWQDHLRVSIDYTRIEKRHELASFQFSDIDYFLRHEDELAGRVTRAALTDADRAKGFTAGVVTAIDMTDLNIGRTLVEAVDLQGDYLIPTPRLGDFRLRAAATWQPHLKRWTTTDSAAVNSVGYADGPLAWRANGGLDWAKGATTLGFNVFFYDRYRPFDSGDSAEDRATKLRQQGASKVPAQAYVDLFATRRVTLHGYGGLREIQLRLGVQNVLDHSPPLIAYALPLVRPIPYSPYGDPRGRRFELSLVGHF